MHENQNSKLKTQKSPRGRGQSVVEMALVVPILVLLLAAIIDLGLAINAWLRVTTAARDATRFTMDAGRPADTTSLVLNKLSGIDFGAADNFTGSVEINIYVITGTTGTTGNITVWSPTHIYGAAPANDPNYPKVKRNTIQERLLTYGQSPAEDMPFTIVEVNYNYTPLLSNLVFAGAQMPMSSYAIVHQYDY